MDPAAALPGLLDAERLEDLFDRIEVVAIPMAMRFRGIDVRTAMLLRGPAGWAEFSPFEEYAAPEASAWLAAALEAAHAPRTSPPLAEIEVNATVPAVPPDEVPSVLARFAGARTVKVKVAQAGQHLEDDLARVAAVRAELGPEVKLRVDANAGWSLVRARAALERLAECDLQYAEQPCAEVTDLARLREEFSRRGIPVPIAADESIRRAEDPLRVARLGAADVMVVKVQPLGGIAAARRVIAEVGLPAVVSSALDTSVGIGAGAELAAHLQADDPRHTLASGLGTVRLLADDVSDPPLAPEHGRLAVRRPEPDESRLERLRVPGRVRTAWLERAQVCWDLLRDAHTI